MTKAWLKNYPKNVAYQIDLQHEHSLLDLFHPTIAKYQNSSAYENFGVSISFNELDKLSQAFAAYLQHELKIKKGDRVALMAPNSLAFCVAMWGIIRVGAIQVNVNPMYTARELSHQLQDAQVDTIVIFSASTPVLAQIIEQTPIKNIIVTSLDDLINKSLPNAPVDPSLNNCTYFTDALMQGQSLSLVEAQLNADDLLFLQYTGGTTGLSKGAMLTHGNLIANILQYHEFAKNLISTEQETVITAIPMYHIFALMANTLCYFTLGAKNVLVTNPRDMPAFVQTWKQAQPSFFTGVNTLFNGLLHTPGFADSDFSHLKLVIGGGAAVQQAVADKWQQVTGVRLNEGYGLSETSPILTLNFGTEIEGESAYIAGIGVPIPLTDISLRDEQGKEVAQGERGELCAKGPQVMQGYWHDDIATKSAFTPDGYFKTGDIAELDEFGFFHIVDRKKDMINVSGFNVFPNEIEAEIAKIFGVLESACIGVNDDKTGEAVKVFVVKKHNEGQADVTEQQIVDFCREQLTAYKVPKHIVFVDEIPKSSVGKLLRRELRD